MSSIGIFDSGVGGLGIFNAIRDLSPRENIIYFADQAHFPYGEKNYLEIQNLATSIVEFLIKNKSKMVIAACNTASVASLHYLRSQFKNTPVVGVVPVVKTISLATLSKKVGILATKLTIESGYLKGLVDEFCPSAGGYKVYYQEAKELVDRVEKGEIAGAEEKIKKYLKIFQKNKVDAIALGSTHLPFFKEQIQRLMGPSVAVFDSNAAVARQVERLLRKTNMPEEGASPQYRFYTTLDPSGFKIQIERLTGLKNPKVEKVSLE